jgi:hypothetical protein
MAAMPPVSPAVASALLAGHHTKIVRIRKWFSGQSLYPHGQLSARLRSIDKIFPYHLTVSILTI